MPSALVPMGSVVGDFGKVAGVIYVGERYYFLLKDGVVSLMPGAVIESGMNSLPDEHVHIWSDSHASGGRCVHCGAEKE